MLLAEIESEGDVVRALCKLTFSRSDGSVFVVPAAASGGDFDYGVGRVPAGATTHEFSTKGQASVAGPHGAKISLHPDGNTHIRADGHPRVGPVLSTPLTARRGEHFVTVRADAVEALPPHVGRVNGLAHSEVEAAIPLSASDQAIRVTIYVNGHEPTFMVPAVIGWTTVRSSSRDAIYVGVAAIPSDAFDGSLEVLAGWDSSDMLDVTRDAQFVFLRSFVTAPSVGIRPAGVAASLVLRRARCTIATGTSLAGRSAKATSRPATLRRRPFSRTTGRSFRAGRARPKRTTTSAA